MRRTKWMFALAAAFLVLAGSGRATAQTVVYYPPGVSYYSAPAVSYYSAPAVYVAAPTTAYYYAPAVSFYTPAVSYYAAPGAVTYTRYGPLGGVRVRTYYYPPVYVRP